jgi:PAS domain S-box-containing protein
LTALRTLGLMRGMVKSGDRRAGKSAQAREMQQAIALLRDYEQSGQGWFWSTDAAGRIDYISECVAKQMGKAHADLLGQSLNSLFELDADGSEHVERSLPVILGKRKTFAEFTVRAAIKNSELWWEISGRPHHDGDGNFVGFRGNGADITERRRSQLDAERLAMYDSLTEPP